MLLLLPKVSIAMFELATWQASFLDFFISLRHYTVIGKQLLISNDRNRVRRVISGLSQDGVCTDLLKNLSVNCLKGDLSNSTTSNQHLFSLVNTFKWHNQILFISDGFDIRLDTEYHVS